MNPADLRAALGGMAIMSLFSLLLAGLPPLILRALAGFSRGRRRTKEKSALSASPERP